MLPCMEPPEVGPSGDSGWPMDGQVGSLQASEAVDQRPDQDFCSALGGIRTPNLLIRSQMLYPLSYERLRGESRGWVAPDAPGRSPVRGDRADLDGAAQAGGGDPRGEGHGVLRRLGIEDQVAADG